MDLIVDGMNSFAIDLYQNIMANKLDGTENTVVSSLSVFIAMLMALAGSKGDTRDEMIKSLKMENFLAKNLNTSLDQNLILFHESIKALINSLIDIENNPEDKTNKFILANKIILNNQKVESLFLSLIESSYNAKVDTSLNVAETNKWISDLTNNKISNILDDSFKAASLILINAVYFNYEWLHEFDHTKTTKQDFHLSKDGLLKVKVNKMEMYQKKFGYFFSIKLNSHLLSLPYKKEKFMFNILFPNDENDFLLVGEQNSLVNKLNYNLLKEELKQQSLEKINLNMPKFSIKKKIELNSILKNLGIMNAFDSKLADFSGISLSDKLYIQEALQYSFIEVNEKGTEAAAATVVKIVKRSLVIEKTIDIKLNRPFVYFITEKTTGAILFIGSFNGQLEETTDEKVSVLNKTEL